MASTLTTDAAGPTRAGGLSRLLENRNVLGGLFLLPAAVILLLFLTYPLGLGVWLGFTDTQIGRPGIFIGLENYEYLWSDSVFWLSVFNTVLYTVAASALKFALGLWLALILNERLPFKAFFRAIVLLPWVVPTVLSAIAFWWIYDAQFSILSWSLIKLGIIDTPINFLGDPNLARASVISPFWMKRTPTARPCSMMRRSTSTCFSSRRLGRLSAGLRNPRADDQRRPRFWLTWK